MRSKRLSALILSALMLLALPGCGGGDAPVSQSSQSQPAVSTLAPAQSQPEVPDISAPPEPVVPPEPEFPYANPLTGEGCMNDISKNRPYAIMINNHKKAQPQAGISQADIIYEIPAEGGITRMMAVFQDVSEVGNIGTVRSARDYYVSLALGMDALYLHAGGSPQAYTFIKSWGIPAFDCVNGPYEGTLFWRDKTRWNQSGMEHSVLTSGEKISTLMPSYGYRLEHKEGYSYPMSFSEEAAPADGQTADTITLKFSNYKTGIFQYDADTGLYYVEQYGGPHIDANTGDQLAVKNVLILRTDISTIKGDEAGRLSVRTTGSGSGIFACGGKSEKITWSRTAESKPMSFYRENGEELVFGVGSSYISLIGSGASYTVE